MTEIWIQIVTWLIASAWIYKYGECLLGLRKVPKINDLGADGSQPHRIGKVVVVVPARNEEKNISACIESLINQDYKPLEIIAVDDRSGDSTGAILDHISEQFPKRVEVAHITRLPSGWLGKTHAMAVAARRALGERSAEWFLFTDADIEFDSGTIRKALIQAESSKADHLVVMPTTIAKTSGEAMVLSFMHVMSLWALRPWMVPNPTAKRDSIGVGAFNLIRAEAYTRIGGFESFPMEILEDLRLGKEVKKAGLRQQVATAPGMVNVHWAPGIRGIVQGITKNLFAVFDFRVMWLMAAALWIAIFCILPMAFFFFRNTFIQGILVAISSFGLYRLSSATSRFRSSFAVLLPVSALVVIYAMLRSMTMTLMKNGVNWRGTFYNLDDLRRYRAMKLKEVPEHTELE